MNAAVRRSDLEQVVEIANDVGLPWPPKILCVGENVKEADLLPVPASPPERTADQLMIAPVADLTVMKLTAFRLIDKVHIQDMDGVGLITPEIEASLPEALRERLREVRATR